MPWFPRLSELSGKQFRWLEAGFLLVVCSALAAAAAAAFPTMDDAYLDLVLRENGPAGVLGGHQDRPLVALLLSGIARLFGPHFWSFAFVAHAILWTILGVQTAALWRQMLPGWSRYALAAGLVAVCPIVVQTQLCTATVTLFGVLSVVLSYGALGVLRVAIARQSLPRIILGLLLSFIAVLVTEYAVAAICATAVLLAGTETERGSTQRRKFWEGAVALIAVAALAYCAFLVISDLGDRPEVDPRRRLNSFDTLESFPFSLVSRAWQVLVGTYGSAFGRLWVERDSPSTIAAAGVGVLIAAAVLLLTRTPRTPDPAPAPRASRIRVLLFAVLAGIAPVAAMRPYSPHPFATRFNLPVLPGAVVLTLGLTLWIVRPRYRRLAVGLLTFVAGATAFSDSWEGVRHERRMREIGNAIRKELAPEGLTGVVVSSARMCESPDWCTGQATVDWPVDLEKRVWIWDPQEGFKVFGSRLGPGVLPSVNVDVRSVRRVGPIRRGLWVEKEGDGFRIEPYFVNRPGPSP